MSEEKNQPIDSNDESQSDELKNENQETVNPEIAELQKKNAEYLDGWKRAKADYINLKKESEKRQSEVIQYANAALLAEFIPIYNNFKLAWKHLPAELQANDWVKGFEHVKKQMADFLKELGIEEIKTVGEQFNPDIHEALAHEAKEGFAPDTICEEVMPGYTLHGKVLQPAKVKVAK